MQTGPFISLGEMKVFHVPVASACRGGGAGAGGSYLDPMCSLSWGTVRAPWGLFPKSDF